MKRPQTKFYADTMSDCEVVTVGQKSQNLSLDKNLSLGQNFFAAQFFIFINILLKLQKQILIYFCKFTCNSDIIIALW